MEDNIIITRAEALETGSPRYFTGKFCVRGHISERYTSSRDCVVCSREYDRTKAYSKYYQNNIKEKREYRREHYKNNKGMYAAKTLARREHIALRTPAWSEKYSIQEFYNNCPEGYHVDHIIPLRGKLVSGLHVMSNLQYLSSEENLRKGNKHGR